MGLVDSLRSTVITTRDNLFELTGPSLLPP